MPQLVNSTCVICLDRISSVLKGDFCAVCGSPTHHVCRDAAPKALDSGLCPECGADPAFLQEFERRAAVNRQAEARNALIEPLNKHGRDLSKLIGVICVVTGLVCLGLGCSILFGSESPAALTQVAAQDFAAGFGPIVVGVLMSLGGVALLWK